MTSLKMELQRLTHVDETEKTNKAEMMDEYSRHKKENHNEEEVSG